MQEKRVTKNFKIKKVCIVGVIPSFAFQRAKFCALELHRKLPLRFPPPEIVGLLELDWNEKLTEWKQTFGRDYWCLRRPVAVFIDNKFIGSDIELIKFATIKNILFENIPRENTNFLKEHFRNDYISYLKKTKRIYCYLDICIEGVYVGTLTFELFSDLVPKTCENFKTLCLGSKGPLFSYKGSRIHRIVKEGWVQGGDIQYKKGGGGYSIFGDPLEDECLGISHNRRGVLSMANCGRNTNGSQFFITLKPSPWMNSRFVAFGQLIEGSHVLKVIENFETSYECPLKNIEIKNCGKLDLRDEEDICATFAKEIPSKKEPKKFETISEQILRLIVQALMSALEKKEHHIDILDDGDVPSKMNLQLYFQGLYSLPEEILIESAKYLRNLRRKLLRVAKPSATEIVEVLVYDLLVATLTRMINLDDVRETLGPDLYKKIVSKIDMQLELCQKPYVKKFVDQVVSAAENMVALVTKKLLYMKKKSNNLKNFQDKMENWLQSFVLQEVFKGDIYHILYKPKNKSKKKEIVSDTKEEKKLSKREGEQCCKEKAKRQEAEMLEKIKKKYSPEEFCCLGKKVFEFNSHISIQEFFNLSQYDDAEVPEKEMSLIDLIETSRFKLKFLRKQENTVKSPQRKCLEEKIRKWMNEVVYTPETMWIKNVVFGKDGLVHDHLEEILYGAMTVGLLEMYYFYEQYLKLCGGKKKKVITHLIYGDEENEENEKMKIKEAELKINKTSETSDKLSENTKKLEPAATKKEQLKPECTCGHPCCVCAYDPHYDDLLGEDYRIPFSDYSDKDKDKLIPETEPKIQKLECPSDMEMVDLNAVMAESTSLKAEEIDISSFRWLRSFILEKGTDLKTEFVTQVHKWLDGERFNYKNFISKHSLVTKTSVFSLSISLMELIMEENKLKRSLIDFIYELWELYFNEMFKEALLQYPPEEGIATEEKPETLKSKSQSDESLPKAMLRGELGKEKGEVETERKNFEDTLEDACKKILEETPEFDFTTYCQPYQTELGSSENVELKNFDEDSQNVNSEPKASVNSETDIQKNKSALLQSQSNKEIASSSKKQREENNEKNIITNKPSEINNKTSSKNENVTEHEPENTVNEQSKEIQEEEKKKYSDSKGIDEIHEEKTLRQEEPEEQESKYNNQNVKKASDTLENKETEKEKNISDQISSSSSSISDNLLNQDEEKIDEEEKIKSDSSKTQTEKKMTRQSPVVVEEIVSVHSSLEERRKMPPYVLPFWIKFLTQLTKQALGTMAKVSRLPRRLYFTSEEDHIFENKVKDWIEFNVFNPQPTKGREIMDFIALHHKTTNLEESVRSYLRKKQFSMALNSCSRMKSAEVIADEIIAAILENAMTKSAEAETVELFVSKVLSSAITSVHRDSEAMDNEKSSSKSYIETDARESFYESETSFGE